MPIDKRFVLRTGFGILIALLIASTYAAYRVQDVLSSRSVEIHRTYVEEQELLTNLRRILWMAGISARDHFINPAPDRLERYQGQLALFKRDSENLFSELGKMNRPAAEVRQTFAELRKTFDELWKTLDASLVEGWSDEEKYRFVQEVIVPRRNAAGNLLRQLERANHASLEQSEIEFAQTRAVASRTLIALLGAVLLIGVVVTRISLKYFENLEQQTARQFEEVSQAKQDLEQLSARLMDIQEEERTRLSRELHDEVVQTLAVLKIEITQAQAASGNKLPEIRENLARARALAERTVGTCRNISLLLRPSLLDDLGLGPALQWLAEDFTRRTRVPCDFSESGLDDHLSEALKTCVYRVSQEALHNCGKHASATHVWMKVARNENDLTVEITDNGVGFQRRARQRGTVNMHFGLLGMRERAAALGGILQMESGPGRGTIIKLWLPVISSTTPSEPLRAETHA